MGQCRYFASVSVFGTGFSNIGYRFGFYRTMHYSAKRGLAIACRLSVRLSVCVSVTLVDHDHIG